jgi:hypothetical protein
VIFAHGSRFGGHFLFIKDGRVTYAYNFLGIHREIASRRRSRRRVRTSSAWRSPRSEWARTAKVSDP